ncbi:MAG TPA: hypothetical protein VKH43_06850 [Thermoanaerobaculia bacterium]|nr:hypothetical protein [Thermoanaerobaculia bacterium]
MPIDFEIDHKHRLVTARGLGTLTHEDVLGYQMGVWGRTDVAGYDELVDMSGVEEIALISMDAVPRLASLSARMDPPDGKSRLAIVAPSDFAFALGRRYETFRGLDPRSTKEVRVFRSLAEALAFLQDRSATSASG